jgi:hypothetical protein
MRGSLEGMLDVLRVDACLLRPLGSSSTGTTSRYMSDIIARTAGSCGSTLCGGGAAFLGIGAGPPLVATGYSELPRLREVNVGAVIHNIDDLSKLPPPTGYVFGDAWWYTPMGALVLGSYMVDCTGS